MTDISVRTDIADVTRWLTRVQKQQIPFATSKTLNELAYQIARKNMPAEADDTFEGGATTWTKRGFKYKRSTKRNFVIM